MSMSITTMLIWLPLTPGPLAGAAAHPRRPDVASVGARATLGCVSAPRLPGATDPDAIPLSSATAGPVEPVCVACVEPAAVEPLWRPAVRVRAPATVVVMRDVGASIEDSSQLTSASTASVATANTTRSEAGPRRSHNRKCWSGLIGSSQARPRRTSGLAVIRLRM